MPEIDIEAIAALARQITLEESEKYGRNGKLLPGAVATYDRLGRLIREG
ncbi:hypothetical protein GS433_18850 [Rhodococcus hoagii]|nr:hypothetical protein [Prescottella equi]MBM4536452.1 hypothetical protein [Prescottella equi]NKR85493.1 hypothetical protein [Prescottella equi]